MSDKDNEQRFISAGEVENSAFMDRLFCSTKERIGYILANDVAKLKIGKYDTDSDIFLYKIYGLSPVRLSRATATLGIYDMINDPLTAIIADNVRTRWGKFKPMQWLAYLPNTLLALFMLLLPLLSVRLGWGETQKLWTYMGALYASETIGALTGGGGGYIANVFTPNPNERTSLLTMARFVNFFEKTPEQIMSLLLDIIYKGVISSGVIKLFVGFKAFLWVVTSLASLYWIIVSKERVAQSVKRPNPIHGFLSVFKNRPLLVYTLSQMVDGINIGTPETLYYSDIVHFNMLPTIAGIPGGPISYYSYALVPKFRKRFSTKTLWLLQRGSIWVSETTFFLFGLIGGKENGMYLKKWPMTAVFALGDCLEMVFYGTKQVIGDEINFEVLDYCEWKNGFRVEATISLVSNYFSKVRDILLRLVNGWLLERWAGFQIGVDIEQTIDTKWRMFLTIFGPRLVFDLLSMAPMLLYNIDRKTRETMYLELEKSRALAAEREKRLAEQANAEAQKADS